MSNNKRKREETNNPGSSQEEDTVNDSKDESKEEDLLVALDEDGNFLTPEQQQEREAERRRMLRKQRLAKVKPVEEPVIAEPKSESEPLATTREPSMPPTRASLKKEEEPPVASLNQKESDNDHEDDDFDMFSNSVSPPQNSKVALPQETKRGAEQQDWDDAEGYYKAVIGEVITLELKHPNTEDESTLHPSVSFRVSGVIGKGVFSTVLKCTTEASSHQETCQQLDIPSTVAIKCIRHNETMAKAALNEIRYLQLLKDSPGIVPLLLPTKGSPPLEHRGHVAFVFPYMAFNLRDVLQKFGKGVGLSLQAVRAYFGQLLAAATHLKQHGLIHADLKPDNILVSQDFAQVRLCDFGSALEQNSSEDNVPTPYRISRFYRAPEIILGLVATTAVDLWSLAVTVAELFLGHVLLSGTSNNDMLFVGMQHLGPISNRMIRQHLVQCQRIAGIPAHFRLEGANYVFLQQTVDPVTGHAVTKTVALSSNSNHPSQDFVFRPRLAKKIAKAKSANESLTRVQQFTDLLQKCLMWDPNKRIAVKQALQHAFFQEPTDASSTNAVT